MQLGKLAANDQDQALSCKTPDLPLQSAQWVTGQKQNIVAHLNERWRVVECAAGIQWILQRRAGERHGVPRWDDRSYCQTKEALIRCCRASAGETEPAARATLAALPERVRPRADTGDDPPDKKRSPAVTSGRANRKSSKPGRLDRNEYASKDVCATAETALAGAFRDALTRKAVRS